MLRYRPEPYDGTHVMLHVEDARAGRELLRRLTPQVDSAADWWKAGEPWISVAVTYSGLMALGVPEDSLQSFPEAFRVGMAARADRLLDDAENDPRHYLFIQEVVNNTPSYLARGKAGFHELLTDLLTGKGTLERPDWAWDELFAFVRLAQTPVRNPLLTTYWTMAAVRHGDYVAKVRVAPASDSSAHAIHGELDPQRWTGRVWSGAGG